MENNLFYLLFLIQIFLASIYVPKRIINQMTYVLNTFSVEQYPKLYPVSKNQIMQWISFYQNANWLCVGIGLFIVIFDLINLPEQMLGFNTTFVLTTFFLLQFVPIIILESTSGKYLKKMREKHPVKKVSVNLTRRRFIDYFDKKWIVITILMRMVFVATVIYFTYHPFDGFGGFENLAILMATDVFFILMVSWQIYRKRPVPHQTKEDRFKVMSMVAKGAIITSNMLILFACFSMFNSAYGNGEAKQIGLLVYFIILILISLQTMLVDVKKLNFDVYRKDQ